MRVYTRKGKEKGIDQQHHQVNYVLALAKPNNEEENNGVKHAAASESY